MDLVSPEPNPGVGEALRAAMNAARKAQDKDRTLVLGTILANLKNREIELRRPPTDEDVLEVLRKGIKTRRESVEQYTAANRPELAETERKQDVSFAGGLGNFRRRRGLRQCVDHVVHERWRQLGAT